MTPSTDTFARFVDELAETLDDATAYAGRLHLSRFHVDRIVSATAGEPPGALRRRILLERAAHRLLTTEEELLPVALDADYSSHEAFTRAFQRAFGDAPSVWRRSARSFELAAPSGVHFHPPGSLRCRAERKVTEMDLVQKMVEHHVWLVGKLVDRGADRELVERLVGQLEMWNAAIEGRSYEERSGDLRGRLDVAGPGFVDHVRDVTAAGRLDETFVDAICDPPEVFTYGGMIAHVLTFGGYRRMLALEKLGAEDLGFGDPMRWVAEAA